LNPIPLFTVDAFARRPFTGNPAAVCLVGGPRDAAWMQNVAREMNLSETAFLHREGAADSNEFQLRWFTPSVEVALCGHATLASAHILWETGMLPRQREARFHTQSGWLSAARRGEEIELDFPAVNATACEAPPALAEAIGRPPRWVGRNRMDYLWLVDTEEDVRALAPDIAAISRLGVRGVIVTAPATTAKGGDYDFVSRFFAPGAGVPEDPVTGSAHCCLAPFWSGRLGRTELVGYQASARGGYVRTRVAGDRVMLGGTAITVMRGELAV
jgi:predicted PhzF superfamily epimerase YddE/YHI9